VRLGRPAGNDLSRLTREVDGLHLPEAIWRTCPWQPRPLIETGLRQWLRCAGSALSGEQIIGMPSHAVDEAWHGLILCTAEYAAFCERAYGQFLHHHPDLGTPLDVTDRSGTSDDQLRRTVVAWSLVARPGEACVLWDLDSQVGVETPWGVPAERVALVERALRSAQTGSETG
jgi:hypothetical protein